MIDKKWLEFVDKPFAGAAAACEDSAGMLRAFGHTLLSYSAGATGLEYVYVKALPNKRRVRVVLSVVDEVAP